MVLLSKSRKIGKNSATIAVENDSRDEGLVEEEIYDYGTTGKIRPPLQAAS